MAASPAPARFSRTDQLRSVEPNLAKWLEPYRDRHGSICPPGLRKRLEADRAAAGIASWPVNAARHNHYRELVKPDKAHQFWEIVPALKSNPAVVRLGDGLRGERAT
jgi:hypothetical protein